MCSYKKRKMQIQRHTQKEDVRNRKWPSLSQERPGIGPSLRRSQSLGHLDFQFLGFRIVRQYIYVVETTQFVILRRGSPRKITHQHVLDKYYFGINFSCQFFSYIRSTEVGDSRSGSGSMKSRSTFLQFPLPSSSYRKRTAVALQNLCSPGSSQSEVQCEEGTVL